MAKPVIAYANDSRYFSSVRIELLEGLGFEVKFCQHAKEVLEQFETTVAQKPVILVTDMRLTHDEELCPMRTRGALDTGMALWKILRARNHGDLNVIIYTTSKTNFERLCERKDSRMFPIYDCDPDSTEQIIKTVRGLKPLPTQEVGEPSR